MRPREPQTITFTPPRPPRYDHQADQSGRKLVDNESRVASLERRPITVHTLYAVIDGGAVALTTGVKLDVQLHDSYQIASWTLLASVSGSIVVDVWKDTYANYPPVVGDSITGSAKPTISSAVKATSATLTGWTVLIAPGDCLRFNIDSVTSITRVTLALELLPL